jgi:general secretion pathway protein K
MRSKQRGVAIVFAMGVVALAALAASSILVVQSTWSRESELNAGHAQAHEVVQAGIDWARAVLGEDSRTSSVDHAGEPWALKLTPLPIENGEIAGRLDDQQGAFNLNNIVRDGKLSVAQLAHFRRLLGILGLPSMLADALADWLDADNVVYSANGAEDDYYLALATPYLAANRALVDAGELALVRGFDASVLARLRPFVTALPRYTQINVNTASPEVIAAMVDGLDLDTARALVAQRDKTYFRDVADFARRVPPQLKNRIADVAVSSDYFMATVRVTIGRSQASGLALLHRERFGWPAIVWRKYS